MAPCEVVLALELSNSSNIWLMICSSEQRASPDSNLDGRTPPVSNLVGRASLNGNLKWRVSPDGNLNWRASLHSSLHERVFFDKDLNWRVKNSKLAGTPLLLAVAADTVKESSQAYSCITHDNKVHIAKSFM